MHRKLSSRRISISVGLAAILGAATVRGDGPAPGPLGPPAPNRPAPAAKAVIAPEVPPPGIVGSSAAVPLGSTAPLPLGKVFERKAAGISIRAPYGWTGLLQADREEVVRFVDDLKKQDHVLSVTRRSFPSPQHLFAIKDDKGQTVPGIMENTLEALKSELAGAKVLRAGDPTNLGKSDVGVIVIRYTKNGERRLAQHAVIQANDQLYFLVAYNTPARKDLAEDNNPEEKTVDPGEQQAVETFRAVLDSIKLLDLRPVREDQTARLFRTRTLFYNLTEKKLSAVLMPERYMRIIREGKDIGYSFIGEGLGRSKKIDRTKPKSELHFEFDGAPGGLSVGIRTRVMSLKDGKVAPFPREDSEAWMYVAFDRRNEDWSKITVFDDGTQKTAENPWRKVSEVGSSKKDIKRVMAVSPNDINRGIKRGTNEDPGQPWVDVKENYHLDVQFKATRSDMPPLNRELSPFYLPQALSELLPRLVPANEPKTYMVATYLSELREIAMRYIDVRPEEPLPAEMARLVGATRGVPVDDRIGYEGAVTTHYVTLKGDYLGSYDKATNTMVVPSDEATLKQIWHIIDSTPLNSLPAGAGADVQPQSAPGGNGAAPLINPTTPYQGLPSKLNGTGR